MKLTESKIEKLVLEMIQEVFARGQNPRRYGKGVLTMVKANTSDYTLADGKINIGWVESVVGTHIGSGYSRMVFRVNLKRTPIYDKKGNLQSPNTPNLVLKLAYNGPQPNSRAQGIESNLMESALFNKYPHCFPRSYGTFRDGEMIVMEEVIVVKERAHYNQVLQNSFTSLDRAVRYCNTIGYSSVDSSWFFEKLLDTFDQVIQPKLKVPLKAPSRPNRYNMFVQEMKESRRTRGMTDEQHLELWYTLTDDTKLMDWITTLRSLGVEFDEIRLDNVGTNTTDDRLFLIDVSKF